MAKISYGIKDRPDQRSTIGIVNLEDMTIEMADEGKDTIRTIYEKFDSKLVKVTFEELPQE